MSDELARLDAVAQAELVRRGKISPQELIDAAIARLERLNPKLNAVIHPALERARREAAGSLPDGPLRGVPFLMKDIGGPEAGEPHHAGMKCLRDIDFRQGEDGYLTAKLRAAGLISLGRTNTPELALLPTTEPDAYGPTRNPWNLGRSAGGSSGGAASAVAAGIVPIAHASDGGGSIRGPASMCGLVGLKPTRGRCSFGPGLGERWSSFSCELAVTRTIRDTAVFLDAACGAMPGDPYFAPPPLRPYVSEVTTEPGALRIGYMTGAPRGMATDPECVTAVEKTAKLLESLGHRVEAAYPAALDEQESVILYVTIVQTNIARALEVAAERIGRPVGPDDVEPLTWALAENGRAVTGAALLKTIELFHGFGRRVAAWWTSGFDLLLTPTQAAPPPEIGYLTSTREEPFRAFLRAAPYGVCTLPFNMSGQPAISLPMHMTADGLPIGVQLVAPYAREDLLLRVGAQLERAVSWTDRFPPLYA